jgi:cobalt-zinc-cadmium efflux system outer membrane protein
MHIRRRRIGAMKKDLLALVVCGLPAVPGAVGATEISLSEAVALALENSSEMAAAHAQIDFADQSVRAAGAGSLPTLALSGSYGQFSGDVLFGRFIPGVPGDGAADVGPYNTNSTAAVELTQVLYAGGGIGAAKRAGGVEQRIAAEDARRRSRDLSYEVTRAFYGVLLAEERVKVAARSVARSKEGLETVRVRHAEQEALEVELLGAEGQVAADELAVLEAHNDLDLARRNLNRLLGRSLDESVSLEGSLADRLTVPPEAQGVEDAAGTSSAVRLAALDVERAEAAFAQARSVGRAKLELKALYTWIDNELFFKGDYAGAIVNLSIPFFQDARAGSAAKHRARAQKRQAEAVLEEAESGLKLQTVAAYRALDASLATVGVAQKNLDYHRERYRVTLSGYREELVTFAEVLDRQDDLQHAELEVFGAQYQARLQEAEIRRLVGDGE